MKSTSHTTLTLHTDGGSRNNPGHAGIGFVVTDVTGEVIAREGKYIGIATNNEAEYQALISGLRHIRNFFPKCTAVHVFTDSELMAKQLTRIYKIKEAHLKQLATAIWASLEEFTSWKITHILREKNKLADQLVNDALDNSGH
jgi:ribonuclease HI